MKLKSIMLTAVFFVFGISSAQAVDVDTGTPDILSSVSSGSVQALTKAESADIRGERICRTSDNSCSVWVVVAWNQSLPEYYGYYWQRIFNDTNPNVTYVSR